MMETKAALGTPESNGNGKALDRPLVTGKHTLGRALIDWLGKLTLSGGDLDGQPFQVWPWERRFIAGTFGQPGNAALSIGRGNGKSAFVAALLLPWSAQVRRCTVSAVRLSVWRPASSKRG